MFPLLRTLSLDHWFLMEPDVLPIRPGWGTRLAALAARNPSCHSFWQAGSMPEEEAREPRRPFSWRHQDGHLNGNALYCLADKGFDEYLHEVQHAFRHGFCGEMTFGYDYAMWKFRLLPDNRGRLYGWHSRFLRSDFIANFDERPYDVSELLSHNPRLMLVHGKTPFVDGGAVRSCSLKERTDALLRRDNATRPTSSSLPPNCVSVASQDFQTFDYSYMLFGAASFVEAGGGVQLTSQRPSEIGHVEFDKMYRFDDICKESADRCHLFAQFEFRLGNQQNFAHHELGDGLAVALVDGSAQLPGITEYTTYNGVVLPRDAIAVLLDEYDNGDGVGYRLVDTRRRRTRLLAQRSGLHARYMRGELVALRAVIRGSGSLLTVVLDGDRIFDSIVLEQKLPDVTYIVISANTGDKAVSHHLAAVHVCLLGSEQV
jgi:hypothetical protein